jgi:DNA-directed RNA polymerase sigma subunit (sigma70/sigma32)
MQIYELHKAGKTARELGEMFGISESRVRAIYWAMRQQQSKGYGFCPEDETV